MQRALLPAGIVVALAVSACGSDRPVGTTTREIPPTTTATTPAATADATKRVASTGYAFDLPPGSWREVTTGGSGTAARREFVDTATGTRVQVARQRTRRGDTVRAAANRVRRNFRKDGTPGPLSSTRLGGERALMFSTISTGSEFRPLDTVIALHDGYSYGITVVGTDPPTSAMLTAAAQAQTTWRWATGG